MSTTAANTELNQLYREMETHLKPLWQLEE